jgi:hypothetical protein
MRLYSMLKSSDSAFPYNVWGERENSFVAKAYTKEMAKIIMHALIENSNTIISAENFGDKNA